MHVCRLSARNHGYIQSSHPSHTMLSWLNESYCKKILKVSGNPARVISKANKHDGLDREQTGKLARRASTTCRDEGADGGVPTKGIRLNTQLPRIIRRRVPTVLFFSQYSHSSQPWSMAHWIFSHWQLFPPAATSVKICPLVSLSTSNSSCGILASQSMSNLSCGILASQSISNLSCGISIMSSGDLYL